MKFTFSPPGLYFATVSGGLEEETISTRIALEWLKVGRGVKILDDFGNTRGYLNEV